jgi:Putative MetA-pathway of phenol degradation
MILLTLAISCTHSAMAQESQTGNQSQTAAEVSKEASNPLSSVWLMQIQQNNTWIGMPANGGNRVQSNLQFQPLMSIKLSDDWSLITRPVLQLVNSTPFQDQSGKSDRATGFGDTVLALAVSLSRKLVGNWLLAAGPTFIFPTATDPRIGQDKWQVGPAAAFGYTGKNFITYVFPQQWFSVGDSGARARHMLMYYAFVYAFKNGWSVGTNPAMTVDWEASSGNKVAFPVGLQVGKLRKLGPMPVKFDVQVQYYAVRPQVYGPKWNLQFQITPILPALIGRK